MIGLLGCAFLTLFCSLVLGQAVLRLCGAQAFSWLSAPVGLSVAMVLAAPALQAPGRTTTVAIVIGLITLAAAVWLAREPAQRPPGLGLLAGLPVLLLGLVPFIANGRVGTLGWSFNNDMATHLLQVDSYKYEAVVNAGGLDNTYPLGMHAWTAVLSTATGTAADQAFAGVTLALPILLGWAALAAIRRTRWWGSFAVVLLVGFPFLVAGYYGQGSFKEIVQALIVMACAVVLARPLDLRPRLRWVPFGVLVAGSLSIYSYTGLVMPGAFFLLWLGGQAVTYLKTSPSERPDRRAIVAGLTSMIIGAGVLFVVMLPQLPRLKRFYDEASVTNGTGIDTSSLGNLAGPLPFWESLGGWSNPDYRIAGPDPLAVGAVAGLVLALVLFGALWSLRRREWLIPAATAVLLGLWYYADQSQSPYVTAKALVLLTPMLMLVAVRPLVERDREDGRWPMPSWWRVAAPAIAVLLVILLVPSSYEALRYSSVGPSSHTEQLQSLRGMLGPDDKVLFLGNDDFIRWELDGVHTAAAVIGFQKFPFRDEKPWEYGKALDIDSIPTATLNQYDWIITPRDAASSMPPPELKLVRQTQDFDVYRRTTMLPKQYILSEGETAVGKLDCTTKLGRTIVAGGGVAAVRPATIVVPMPDPIEPGATATVTLPLPAGRWDLVAPYGGPRPVEVTGPGLKTTLPANLDRPGVRWPIGRITTDGTPVTLTLHPTKNALTPPSSLTFMGSIQATPVGQEKIVPVAQACGKLVDWYRPATE